MFAIALLSLLGIGLIVDLADDDDENETDAVEGETDQIDGAPAGPQTQAAGDGQNIFGGSNDDIAGLSADTTIISGGGDDFVTGGAGDDFLIGESGDDAIFGQGGDDFIRGGADNDILVGGDGNDTLRGDTGEDIIYGADIIDEPAFIEAVRNSPSTEIIQISDFLNFETETGEADTLVGGLDNDILFVGANDEASTGTGQDIVSAGFWIEPGESAVVTDFEQGEDVIVYSYEEDDETPTVTFGENDENDAQVLINNEVVLTLRDVDFQTLTFADIQLFSIPTLANRV